MVALSPIPIKLNLELRRKHLKEKKKRIRPVKVPKSPEVKYRKQLYTIVNDLINDVNTNIVTLLRELEPQYVNDRFFKDAYAHYLEQAFDRMRRSYSAVNDAKSIAESFVNDSDQTNIQRFYSAVNESLGVDMQSIVQNEGLEDILVTATSENVSLIRSIPEKYFDKIESIVYRGTIQGDNAESMIQQIQEAGKVTENRAKLIARDQSSKLNSALVKQRSQNLGSEEYIWRTAGDERVRPSHKSKNGKTYRWDDPPKDTGNPGDDIQCRCVAQPIINIQ